MLFIPRGCPAGHRRCSENRTRRLVDNLYLGGQARPPTEVAPETAKSAFADSPRGSTGMACFSFSGVPPGPWFRRSDGWGRFHPRWWPPGPWILPRNRPATSQRRGTRHPTTPVSSAMAHWANRAGSIQRQVADNRAIYSVLDVSARRDVPLWFCSTSHDA